MQLYFLNTPLRNTFHPHLTFICVKLKRMKSVEEERDALLKGLQTVERTEQWYRDQLAVVQVHILLYRYIICCTGTHSIVQVSG